MSKIIEYKNKYAFHPGDTLEEWIEDSGLTQEEFAMRAGTSPKNVSMLLRGEQDVSVDMAVKISRVTGIGVDFWLTMQAKYNTILAEIESDKELEKEKETFRKLGYSYFKDNYGLWNLDGKLEKQIRTVRAFLSISSLRVLENRDFSISFRSIRKNLDADMIVRANALVQIGINRSLLAHTPSYDRDAFLDAIDHVLSLTGKPEEALSVARMEFQSAGVNLEVLPDMSGSGILGATKKVRDGRMLLVTDNHKTWDTFWFTLLHECSHILSRESGISLENDEGKHETRAENYALRALLPEDGYRAFVAGKDYSETAVHEFALNAKRDPGVVVARLQHDGVVESDNMELNHLKQKFDKVKAVGKLYEVYED